jgi:phosphate uptake regulator
MVASFFRGGDSTMDEVEDRIHQMVLDARVVYDTAMEAVFGGGKSKETKSAVKDADHEINVAQRDVRRALLIHSSVAPATDVAQVLSYMSVVKDVERIGDYSKNLYDLAKYGVDFEAADDRAELASYRDLVGQLIDDAAAVFASRNTAGAESLVSKANAFLDEYDSHVKAAYRSSGPADHAVARALYYRFLKRITAHVMNFLTALVLPLDLLDYYDEPSDDD